MILSFFHDHKFMEHEGCVYTTGTLSKEIWDRYLVANVNKINVCARVTPFSSTDKGAVSSHEKVSFIFSPDLSNIQSLFLNKGVEALKKVVAQSDIVLVRLPSEIGLHAAKEAIRNKKILICEVVGCPKDALGGLGSIKAKLYANLAMLRMKKIVKNSDATIYVTDSILQKKYPCLTNTTNISNVEISNIVNSSIVLKRLERFHKRKSSNSLKIGLIGSVKNKIKGVDLAIRAMVSNLGALHVIGSGEPGEFINLAKSLNVPFFFDGFYSSSDDVFSWLDDVDIYIQPSLQEGLPRATIEAMSRGCPVISSDAGGLTELTRPGFVHKKGDYKKLSKDISRFIEMDQEGIKIMIEHSLNTAQKYLISDLSNRRANFLINIISSKL